MPSIANYHGIIPAISCPFTPDHRIDEPALRKLASWLAGHEGVVAVIEGRVSPEDALMRLMARQARPESA